MKVGHVYPKEYEKVCNTVQRWWRLGIRQQKGLAHFLCHVYTFTKKNVTSHKKCARLCTTVLRIGRTGLSRRLLPPPTRSILRIF